MPIIASSTSMVATVAELRAAVRTARGRGERIGLVPTMGALHEGHLRLVDEARRRATFVVMSIFVNPLQFGPGEDFTRYPRDTVGDVAKAAARGTDIAFLPSVEEMYSPGRAVAVVPERMQARWEGAVRPGHFAGVLTVVAKLFNIVAPDVAVFGQKDYQQATLVRAMARDLDFPIEIVVAPTTREPDGLALSSRNAYLGEDDRRRALVLSRALRAMRDAWRERGEHDAKRLLAIGERALADEPDVRSDYLALVDPDDLEPVETARASTVALVAARVGPTRLIDNLVLGAS